MPHLFNESELLDRVGNDWDFLSETIEMLSTDGRFLLDEIRTATSSNDAPTVARAAHTLKGMISNFCSPIAQASALELEKVGKSNNLSQAPAALTTLESQFTTLVNELQNFLSRRPQ